MSRSFNHNLLSSSLGVQVWDKILPWFRVLWVCRISASSAGFGLLLFTLADPARDLFMEVQPYWLYWTGFFAMVLAWALIVHYAARKALEQQAWAAPVAVQPLDAPTRAELVARYSLPAAWVPRLLGLLCLYAIYLGITGAAQDLKAAQKALGISEPMYLLRLLAIITVAYLAYLILRQQLINAETRHETWGDYIHDFVTGESGSLLKEPVPFWFFDLATRTRRQARWQGQRVTWDIVAFVLMAVLATVWLVAVIWPWLVETITPRALFVILMLGLPVPLLTFMSALSHYLRLPVIAGLILLFTIATGLMQSFHDLRPAKSGTAERLALREAVRLWARHNNCKEPITLETPCNARPVIIASAGGASRAAFFTASVVGDILQNGHIDFSRHLFAISGVSGGAVGAAVIRAALDDAGPNGTAPCQNVGRSWFRAPEELKPPYSWKACLQALTAGDFLSRPFVGLAFRDLFGFPLRWIGMSDRAVLLETAFEDQYRALVRPDGGEDDGLGRVIGAFPHAHERWAPLLILNATSVLDGRRVIISDLLPFHCKVENTESGEDRKIPIRIFPATVDLFEMIDDKSESGVGRQSCSSGDQATQPLATGVRLSTGATLSARFPIISPHARLHDQHGKAIDWLVDGGYFENDGLTSARQLAEAMRAVEPGLMKPVIVHITNNPTSESISADTVAPRSAQDRPFDVILAPLRTLVATRDGHAAEAIKAAEASPHVEKVISFQVYDTALPQTDKPCSLARAVRAEADQVEHIKSLSMSWWLSGAVQKYLDLQTCHASNVGAFMNFIDTMESKK